MIKILTRKLNIFITAIIISTNIAVAKDASTISGNNKQLLESNNRENITTISNSKKEHQETQKLNFNQLQNQKHWHITQQNTDLREFITQISKIVGKTFVIDPKVKGGNNVTVLSSKALTANEAFEVFCQVMAVNGYSVLYKGDVINIVPQASAKNSSNFGDLPAERGVISTQVIELKNIPAMEAMSIVKPLISQFGHVAASISVNSIIISDVVENIENINKILDEMDLANDYEVMQLQQAWVTDVAHIITNTLNLRGNNAHSTQIIADENSNRLVVRANKSKRDQIRHLVATLDNSNTQKTTTKVIFLKHADATNISQILAEAANSLVSTKGSKQHNRSSRNNSLGGLIQSNVSKSGGATYSAQANGVFVKPDESQNALVMIADPDILKELENIVRKLDAPRSQVLLEAIIVEISNDFNNEFGVKWENIIKATSGAAAGTTGGAAALGAGGLFSAALSKDGDISLGGDFNLQLNDLGFLVKALKTDSKNNILSTPSILTLDNTKSEFLVGENIPIQTGSYQTNGNNQNPFTTKERKNVGIQLKVTPHINAGNSLRLVIEQEISSLDSATSIKVGNDIVYKNRTLKTTVLVEDRQTIVIGGLIENNSGNSKKKIPILGDLPIIGRLLFTQNTKNKTKKNLMLFLRPTIVNSNQELSQITLDRYSNLKIIAAKSNDINMINLPDDYHNLIDYSANSQIINKEDKKNNQKVKKNNKSKSNHNRKQAEDS